MMTDPIADMLSRIKNACNARHEKVVVPFSKIKERIATILKEEGFINGVEVAGTKTKKSIVLTLRYAAPGKPIFSEFSRISKCGCRVYLRSNDITQVRYGRGIAILSTSKGVMKDSDAKKNGVGGEILCTIW